MKFHELTKTRLLRMAVVGGLAVALSGCEAVALTALGVGSAAGVQHGMGGVTYRTFTAPASTVKSAALKALNHMKIRVDSIDKAEGGEVIHARTNDRNIEVEIQALSSNTTRLRTVARQGVFFDSATAYEIIIQTEKIMANVG